MRSLFILSFLIWQISAFAQDTLLYKRYSFTHYSGQPYQSIETNSTLVNLLPDWDDTLSGNILLPLNFYYQNIKIDSLAIHTNGSLVLNNVPVSYLDEGQIFGIELDYESKNRAKIYYSLSGQQPNRVFKVEFNSLGLLSDVTGKDSISFQIWLKEIDSSIEFHVGPHNIDDSKVAKTVQDFVINDKYTPFLGIINNPGDSLQSNFDKVFFHYVSDNNSSFSDSMIKMNKTVEDVTANTYVNSSLKKIPPLGDVFVFKPHEYANIRTFAQLINVKTFPNPCLYNSITISGIKGQLSYTIYNNIGSKILTGETLTNHIDVASLPKGIYYMILSNKIDTFYSKIERL